jgi:DNA-binding SARP family transcriptional activator
MKRWRLMMLGPMIASPVAGASTTLPAGAWTLLGFLVAQPHHDATRDAAAAALWPDQPGDAARPSLATLIWRIKSVFGEAANPLVVQGERLSLRRRGSLWIDALALEHRAQAAMNGVAAARRARVRRQLLALSGDFLPTIDTEWALLERERLRCLRLDGLFAVAIADSASGDWLSVVQAMRALCAAEPLREDAQRLLMLGYAQTGNRALAIRQYARCAHVLADELGIDPMPETRRLHRHLVNGGALWPDPPASCRPLAVETDDVRTALIAARETMSTAIGLIDRALPPLS